MIDLFRVAMAFDAYQNVEEVLRSGYIGQGPKVEEFERALMEFLGAPHPPVTVNSGTAALELALMLIGVGPGDEVISTPVTCSATNAAIHHTGATIVWADVSPTTGLISPEDVASKMTLSTKAIVAVDWGGAACDYDALKSNGVPVVEDAAHAFGSLRDGVSIARNGGDYVCWSFQAIKHLTTGDGGALLTPPEQAVRARNLRWFGLDRTSKADFRCEQEIVEVGRKMHMNDISAAIGLANLTIVENVLDIHRDNAMFYGADSAESAWWIYTILLESRADFIAYMRRQGVVTSPVHSPNDLHRGFWRSRYGGDELRGVRYFTERNVAIPVGWWVTDKDRTHIKACVEEWHGDRADPQRA